MDSSAMPYVLSLFAAAVVCLTIAIYAWSRRPRAGATPLAVLMFGAAIYSLPYAMQVGSTSLAGTRLWYGLTFPGAVVLAPAWLAFALEYTGRDRWCRPRVLAALAVVPLVTVVIAWTNDLHGLYGSDFYIVPDGPLQVLEWQRGIGFWLHFVYAYVLFLAGTILLLFEALRSRGVYRGQIGWILVGAAAPVVANLAFNVGIVPVRLLDPTPYAFVLTGLAWAWGLFRHRLLTIVPIARDTVIESMRDGVLVLDLHHRIVDVNPALTRIIDRDPSDVVGRTYEEVFRPWPDLADLLQAGLKDVQEINTVAGDLRRHIELQVSGLRNRRSRLVGRLIVARDITRRKQVEEARRESEARYRAIVEQQTDLVCRFRPDGTPTFVNQAYCRYFNKERDEILMRGFEPMIHEEDRAEAGDYLSRLGPDLPSGTLEHRVVLDDGEIRWLQWRNRAICDDEGCIVEFQGVGRDVTKRRQMEEQLREYTVHLEQLVAEKVRELDLERAKTIQTAKLASLGEMATGVAHELNQPLTSILFDIDYLRTMAQRAPDRSPLDLTALRQVTDDMANDVARCRRIIDHLRAFGRSFDAYDTSVVLNQPIEDSFILVGERLRQNLVEVTLDLAADLPPVLASPHQLEQVFLNLISNAEHAMEQMACRVEQGEVTCSSYQKNLRIVTYAEDDCVVAEVSDNGCGIPEDHWERIFEPFFTTKPVGEGTGLGLSISFGIVRKFGGEITFESEENKGTTFTLRFPVAAERGRAD